MASRRGCLIAVGSLALGVYLNTLPAGLTFDDNFAIVRIVRATLLASIHEALTQ